MGLHVDDLTNQEEAAESQGVSLGTIATIQTLFGSASAAFAYLLMVVLYVPCVAAVGAIYREVGGRWTVFTVAWTTALGYSAATIFYQTVNFAANPLYASICIGLSLTILALMVLWMKAMAKKDDQKKNVTRRVIPIMAIKD